MGSLGKKHRSKRQPTRQSPDIYQLIDSLKHFDMWLDGDSAAMTGPYPAVLVMKFLLYPRSTRVRVSLN
jgi:hypothetical protein